MKQKKHAVLTMCLGELWWEFANFAPHVIWKRLVQYKGRDDIDFISMTRPDRFDIYGLYSNIFVPLKIDGDGTKYRSNGFRLDGFSEDRYNLLVTYFKEQYVRRYSTIELVYPIVSHKNYVNRHQFSLRKMLFSYLPRSENLKICEQNLPEDKKIVVLSPRFRLGFKRNWPFWQDFYDMLYSNKKLMSEFFFVICGKSPDYVPDKYNRFLDINNIQLGEYSSLIGLTIEILRSSILTIGSQSGIPNVSLMLGTPVLEWGHERQFHTIDYNLRGTKVKFIVNYKYDLSPEIVLDETMYVLKNGIE
jgi:hypothetical protein